MWTSPRRSLEYRRKALRTGAEARKTLQIRLGSLKSQQKGNRLVDVQC